MNAHKNLRKGLIFVLMFLGIGLLLVMPSQAQSVVSLDTSSLTGQGTYYLYFELLDGSGTGDGNSQATISDLSLTGGSLGAALFSDGTVSGTPTASTGLTLIDSDAATGGVADYAQAFTVTGTPSLLSFDVGLQTTPPLDTPIPDAFDVLLLESDGMTPVPTDGPTGVELVASLFTSTSPTLTGYTTAPDSPVTLMPTILPLGNSPSVPEPGSLSLLALGALPLVWSAARWRRRTVI
jgi:hypothetical protein